MFHLQCCFFFFCISFHETLLCSGSLKWHHQTGIFLSATPAMGSDGAVYMGTTFGDLIAFTLSGNMAHIKITTGNIS